ncbi:MAG: molybdenum ABC transporter ATP-binding protein [Oleiphilaceae bacterium]|nr:molybdenum ABC transporter ATP-binding protein [Oleiphilaceae bacterium]
MTEKTNLHIRLRRKLPGFTLDADLALPGKGVTAVFGPSGCGKTTLLRCIAGLERAEGYVSVNGHIWQEGKQSLPVHRRPLALVFQESSLFPHLSVQRNLDYGFNRIAESARQVTMAQAVHWLGLTHLLSRMPDGLSGGERQRVAIARALLTSPRLLLMDEPLSALDTASRSNILPYLDRLREELAIPVIYVTHARAELARIADHVVMMDQGRVVAAGELTEISGRLDLPDRDDEELGVILDTIIGDRDLAWHLCRADFDGGPLWVRDSGRSKGSRLRLRILARDVSLALTRNDDQSIFNLLPATITDIREGAHPAMALVAMKLGKIPLLARLTRLSAHRLELMPGKKVWVQIKSVAVLD